MFARRLGQALALILPVALAACAPAGAPSAPPTPYAAAPAGTTAAGASVPVTTAAAAAGAASPAMTGAQLRVLATETFLADIARNVAGDRAAVTSLVPVGVDPHAFEPTPADVRQVAEADLLLVNGAGFEGYLADLVATAGAGTPVIEAAAGLAPRTPRAGEAGHDDDPAGEASGASDHEAGDPHFWLDPVLVMDYAANIRDGLTKADPAGAALYAANAEAYQQRLADLDGEIRTLLAAIPENERVLVTNHESLGYFADRYGFQVVGTVIPSASTGASPSARQMADLVETIRRTGARAIFLETGANAQLARQVADEAGVAAVTDLYTHSVSAPDGPAPTYIDMMRANARAIATALGTTP